MASTNTSAPLLIVLVLLGVTAGNVLAADPYEPNDSALNASGPLGPAQVLAADLASSDDADFYLFYVTGPPEARAALTVENTGGGTMFSDIDVTVLDTGSTTIGAMPFIRKGEV